MGVQWGKVYQTGLSNPNPSSWTPYPFQTQPLVTKLWDLGRKRAAFGIITCSHGWQTTIVGGWVELTNPSGKYAKTKMGSSSPGFRGWKQKMFELPPLSDLVFFHRGDLMFFLCYYFCLAFWLRCLTKGGKCRQTNPSYWNHNAILMKNC